MLSDDAWTGPVEPLLEAVGDDTPVGIGPDVAGALLAGVIRSSSAALVGCDTEERIVAWSVGAERLFGYSRGQVIGQPWTMLLSEEARSSGLHYLGVDVLAGEVSGRIDLIACHRDRSVVPVSIEGRPVRVAGTSVGISWTFRDLAARRRVQRAAEVGTFVVDLGGDGKAASMEASAGVSAMLGLDPCELQAMPTERYLDLVEPADRPAVIAAWRRCFDGAGEVDIEHRLATREEGGARWVRISADVYRRRDGRPWRCIGAVRNVTAERRGEALLAYEEDHDRLTRLPKAPLLQRRLAALLAEGGGAVVLSIDLDRFGVVNELHGSLVGDRLLVAVAERLRVAFATDHPLLTGPNRVDAVGSPVEVDGLSTSTPDASPIARAAGDSFVVVCPDRPDRPPGDAEELAGRVQGLFDEPFFADDQELWLTTCVGSARSSADADAEMVVARADRALHQAKRRGPVWALAYESLEPTGLPAAPAQIGALRHALAAGHITVAYQPSVDLATGRVVGVEALARWPEPADGGPGPVDGPQVSSPGVFVPLAEESGLITTLDSGVLELAVQQLVAWGIEVGGLPDDFTVAVNVSARDLAGDRLLRGVDGQLRSSGIDPRHLVLEVTETAVMEDIARTADTIRDLRRMGVGVAIDDFGTGYSSLAYLERLSVDVLKLDGSFAARLDEARDRAVVAAVVELAHTLDFRVVAEGVETADRAAALFALGCRYGQGHHLGRPGPAEDITRLLRAGR